MVLDHLAVLPPPPELRLRRALGLAREVDDGVLAHDHVGGGAGVDDGGRNWNQGQKPNISLDILNWSNIGKNDIITN